MASKYARIVSLLSDLPPNCGARFNLITFANAVISPICDIEQPVFRRYSLGCYSRPDMKSPNRHESPRIDIKLRCRVTSLRAWAQNEMDTANIAGGSVFIGSHGPRAASIGQIVRVEHFRSFYDQLRSLEASPPLTCGGMA